MVPDEISNGSPYLKRSHLHPRNHNAKRAPRFELSVFELYGAVLRPLVGFLGACGAVGGTILGGKIRFASACPAPGSSFELSRGSFRQSWTCCGPSWGSLGPSWRALGVFFDRLGAVLEASWAVLGSGKLERVKQHTMSEKKPSGHFDMLRRTMLNDFKDFTGLRIRGHLTWEFPV